MAAALQRMPRPVSPELMRFHRNEQMRKLKAIAATLLRFKKVNPFNVLTQGEEGSKGSPGR